VRTLVDALNWANLALFALVAVAALVQWRQRRGRAALWAALTFATLALVAASGRILPENPTGTAELTAQRVVLVLLLVFPYLLYRFTTAFEPPAGRLERLLGLMTIAVVAWTILLPDIPAEGEPRSAGFIAYLVAFLVHWTVLTVVVAVRLWRAGREQPSVSRRRMRLLSGASAAITLAILIVASSPGEASPAAVVAASTATLSGVLFLLALAPPAFVRAAWRRPEEARAQAAIADLMGATTEEEVARTVLEPMAALVGARALALRDADGGLLGTHGASDRMIAAAEGEDPDLAAREDLLHIDIPGGSLLVWRSPYAPFFGHEELQVLRTLGALTGLALDRSRLFEQERSARIQLERADEVKTNFVALAAHELRTPVATIDGIISTLAARRDVLPPEQRRLLENTLRQQSSHMRSLVDQLLDLSRLDAEAVAIAPERLRVRERVEGVVSAAAGDRARDVRVEIDPALEAVADANAFDRIVSNLVLNALRHGEPPVRVRATREDRHLRLAVEDQGAGVPPEFVPDLFERFTRSRVAGERVAGTGLGLAIARSYANAHGGDLVYETAHPQGARFNLVLPVEPRSP
jgi:signal transduction histidine kinase